MTTINWSGTKYYRRFGDEIRSAQWYESGAIRCTSIRQIIKEFRIGNYTAMNWTAI